MLVLIISWERDAPIYFVEHVQIVRVELDDLQNKSCISFHLKIDLGGRLN